MATLTGQTIASSYEQLLHVDTDGGGNTTTLVPVKDGDNGTTFAMQLSTTTVCIDNPTADSSTQGGILRLQSDDGALMQSGSRLGVIEFAGAEDSSNNITVGGTIESETDAAWSASENGAYMSFYTTDGNASQSEQMRIDALGNVGIGGISSTFTPTFAVTGTQPAIEIFDSATSVDFFSVLVDNDPKVLMEFDHASYLGIGTSTSKGFNSFNIRMKIDDNSRISLGNNDLSAVTSTTIFGY